MAQKRVRDMFSLGILPPAIAFSNVKLWSEHPGWLKSHDWQLMSGLAGCYCLHGLLGAEQQRTIFAFLILLGALTARRFERSIVPELRGVAVQIIAEMERVLPACESGVLRHLIIHLAEHVATAGPLWVHAMWPWERMWGQLVGSLKQTNNPAASISFRYHSFSVARERYVFLPPIFTCVCPDRQQTCVVSLLHAQLCTYIL